MGYSLRLILVSPEGGLLRLTEVDYHRLHRGGGNWGIPSLAGRRVRIANLVIELLDRRAHDVVSCGYGFLSFVDDGSLDIERLNREQVARLDAMLAGVSVDGGRAKVVDAAHAFIARGGSWQPERDVERQIRAAALGEQPCPRVQVLATARSGRHFR